MTKLFIDILYWIQGFISNYGWSVIVFTMLIKLVLLPLDVKSRRSMRQMAMLNPKLEEIKKRYANDQEKLNMKTQELYKKNGVNPLSGCLPMLIQLPILYIFFAAMRRVSAEMQIEMLYNWAVNNNLVILGENGVFEGLRNVDSVEVQKLLEAIRGGTMTFEGSQSWLWIKSVYQADNFTRTIMPTLSDLTTNYSQYASKLNLDANKQAFITAYIDFVERKSSLNGANAFLAQAIDEAMNSCCGYQKASVLGLFSIKIPTDWSYGYINGYCVLPVLACLTQILATKLQPGTDQSADTQNGSGKFMKWLFPLMSLWICMTTNAAFAIYWVFVNVWSIISSYAIQLYLARKDGAPKNNGGDTTKKEALQP